jgi:hypothetical protein
MCVFCIVFIFYSNTGYVSQTKFFIKINTINFHTQRYEMTFKSLFDSQSVRSQVVENTLEISPADIQVFTAELDIREDSDIAYISVITQEPLTKSQQKLLMDSVLQMLYSFYAPSEHVQYTALEHTTYSRSLPLTWLLLFIGSVIIFVFFCSLYFLKYSLLFTNSIQKNINNKTIDPTHSTPFQKTTISPSFKSTTKNSFGTFVFRQGSNTESGKPPANLPIGASHVSGETSSTQGTLRKEANISFSSSGKNQKEKLNSLISFFSE